MWVMLVEQTHILLLEMLRYANWVDRYVCVFFVTKLTGLFVYSLDNKSKNDTCLYKSYTENDRVTIIESAPLPPLILGYGFGILIMFYSRIR